MGLLILLGLLAIYTVLLRNELDQAVDDYDRANQQIAKLITINRDQAGAIDLLHKQLALNDAYIDGLEQRRSNTEQQAAQAESNFKKAKHENPSINEWANQPLPTGLY